MMKRLTDAYYDWYPPISVGRSIHAIGVQLDDMDAFNPTAAEEIEKCLYAIARKLPSTYKFTHDAFTRDATAWAEQEDAYNRQPSVSLHDLLPVAECILLIHAFFCDGPIRDLGLFAELRRQLFLNQASYHHKSLVDVQRGRVPHVTDVDEEPTTLIDKFLGGTLFWDLFYRQVPYQIPRKTFASHGIILAPPNHGKTQLLGSLLAGFIGQEEPETNQVGCFVLDPHGDLFHNLRDRVSPFRLVTLDPDTNPPPLNFLDFGTSTEAQTLQTFSYLMSSLSGGLSEKQGAIVPYLLKMLRQIPGASLETLRLIVDEKVKTPDKSHFASAIRALPLVDQGFFHNQFYNARMQETKDAIGWKLYSALSSDAFRQMFSAKTNSFDADAAMRERKVVLVKGARQALGNEGMQVFLQFIVAQFFSAALRRERMNTSERHLCILFADEAHHIFNSQTANILTECRKYGLGFIAATQVVQQIPEDVKAAIYGATAIKISGPVSHNDAMGFLLRDQPRLTTSKHSAWARTQKGDDAIGVYPKRSKTSFEHQILDDMDTLSLKFGVREAADFRMRQFPELILDGIVPQATLTLIRNKKNPHNIEMKELVHAYQPDGKGPIEIQYQDRHVYTLKEISRNTEQGRDTEKSSKRQTLAWKIRAIRNFVKNRYWQTWYGLDCIFFRFITVSAQEQSLLHEIIKEEIGPCRYIGTLVWGDWGNHNLSKGGEKKYPPPSSYTFTSPYQRVGHDPFYLNKFWE